MRGYKVFNHDWRCRDFQYKVGCTYKMPSDEIAICHNGFHFCEKLINCFDFYRLSECVKIAEVEAFGRVITENDKSVTNEIRIIREIPFEEALSIINFGSHCEGRGNNGDYNLGDYNNGYHNVGSANIGSWNVGNRNLGDYNYGDGNVGCKNYGSGNVGDYNVGSNNSGCWNLGSNNSVCWNLGNNNAGFFNIGDSLSTFFNKPAKLRVKEYSSLPGIRVLDGYFSGNQWVFNSSMTDVEKESHPSYKITGGYLRVVDFKTACEELWNGMGLTAKKYVLILPNFDPDIFKKITSINVFENDRLGLEEWFNGLDKRTIRSDWWGQSPD